MWKNEMLNSSKDLSTYEALFKRDVNKIENEPTIKDVLEQKYWELNRGVYNCKFNMASKDKTKKEMINELWIFCFEELKKEFWIKRCNEVNEIEQSLGIKRSDKRVSKFKDRDMECEDKMLENKRKKIKIHENNKNSENILN
ncbi:hypothetical protein C1646_752196 [Rhizophagus diaphanus]|nr:hypothetical protein C1646_752196 [Rhizophagus diaphanus] [Rhizophagus sp. MUCL 43196]